MLLLLHHSASTTHHKQLHTNITTNSHHQNASQKIDTKRWTITFFRDRINYNSYLHHDTPHPLHSPVNTNNQPTENFTQKRDESYYYYVLHAHECASFTTIESSTMLALGGVCSSNQNAKLQEKRKQKASNGHFARHAHKSNAHGLRRRCCWWVVSDTTRYRYPAASPSPLPPFGLFMMHPKPVITSSTTTKRGHSCSATSEDGTCPCGPVSKRPACSGGEGGGGEDTLADSLFSLVTVAEQQRQAQERSGGSAFGPANAHLHPLSCSAPAALTARQTIYPPAERLITFTTAKREYPHLRPVPLQELSSIKLFRAWVRKSFELKEDCIFLLVDRSQEGNKEDEELIDSDSKLLSAKDIEIVEVSPDDERVEKEDTPNTNNNNNTVSNINQTHHELIIYAKSILIFLSEKGNAEARCIVSSCPSSFPTCTPSPSSSSTPSDPSPYPLLPLIPLHTSTGSLMSSSSSSVLPPVLPRILAQAPPCLIPGYYIFSPVFDSFGEKRKLPIKIEIPRALVFNGERYKTVSTYIGLGPFGNDPNSFVKLEGDHLVGTVASRLEDDEEGVVANPMGAHVCTYVFKNLRLKTRSLIRTVLDVSYNGMRTGRFFFMVDNEVLPNTSRRFEIKAPSGYTIKMVNKTARSNPVAKHTQPTSPPQSQSQPSSPTLSRPPSPPDLPVSPRAAHYSLSQSQPLPPIHPSIALPPRPHTPPSSLPSSLSSSLSSPLSSSSSSQSSPTIASPPLISSPFPQLQLPPAVLMQMKQAQKPSELLPQSPRAREVQAQAQAQAAQQQAQAAQAQAQAQQTQVQAQAHAQAQALAAQNAAQAQAQAQTFLQMHTMMSYTQAQQKSPRGTTLSPPTMPKGFPATASHTLSPLSHAQLHTQTQQAQQPAQPAAQRLFPQLSQQQQLSQQSPQHMPQLPQLSQQSPQLSQQSAQQAQYLAQQRPLQPQPQPPQKPQTPQRAAQPSPPRAPTQGPPTSTPLPPTPAHTLPPTLVPATPSPTPSTPSQFPPSIHHSPPPAVTLLHRPVIA